MVTKIYAGIGSRETPPEILERISNLAEEIGRAGWLLRSGGALGADTAFERGCNAGSGQKEIILPWKGFNGNLSPIWLPTSGKVFERATLIAQQHHYWPALTLPARKLHTRNVLQIMGVTLVERVDCVICWTEKGRVKGGTATAIKVARALNIPVFNLALRPEELQLEVWRKM